MNDLLWLTDIDIESAIEKILLDNVAKFMVGEKMTVIRDTSRLTTQIKKSPIYTRNPEELVKDASVILREKVPYLKKKIARDRVYKKLIKSIERERDRFPSESVSSAIDAYIDHSIKINAAWILSSHDLDKMGVIEHIAQRQMPMKLKIILMGLPGRMDEEMNQYRNKVAIAVFNYLKEESK